jgi:hypothetical protein
MLFQQKPSLEIEWDHNWYQDQTVAYHIKIKVEKVKSYGNNFLNLLRPFSIYFPKRKGKKVTGTIIQCDLKTKENKLILDLPVSIEIEICKGDVLDLSMSDKGWCIHLEKIN